MKHTSDNLFGGFTLFELVVVLSIISAMVAVVMPFCKKSNDGLKVQQAVGSIAQVIRYGIDLADRSNRAVKFIYDDSNRSYRLEIENSVSSFKPVEDFTGTQKFLDKNIDLYDTEGFEQAGGEFSVVFDPKSSWRQAWISFSTEDLIMKIRVNFRYVEIQQQTI